MPSIERPQVIKKADLKEVTELANDLGAIDPEVRRKTALILGPASERAIRESLFFGKEGRKKAAKFQKKHFTPQMNELVTVVDKGLSVLGGHQRVSSSAELAALMASDINSFYNFTTAADRLFELLLGEENPKLAEAYCNGMADCLLGKVPEERKKEKTGGFWGFVSEMFNANRNTMAPIDIVFDVMRTSGVSPDKDELLKMIMANITLSAYSLIKVRESVRKASEKMQTATSEQVRKTSERVETVGSMLQDEEDRLGQLESKRTVLKSRLDNFIGSPGNTGEKRSVVEELEEIDLQMLPLKAKKFLHDTMLDSALVAFQGADNRLEVADKTFETMRMTAIGFYFQAIFPLQVLESVTIAHQGCFAQVTLQTFKSERYRIMEEFNREILRIPDRIRELIDKSMIERQRQIAYPPSSQVVDGLFKIVGSSEESPVEA